MRLRGLEDLNGTSSVIMPPFRTVIVRVVIILIGHRAAD